MWFRRALFPGRRARSPEASRMAHLKKNQGIPQSQGATAGGGSDSPSLPLHPQMFIGISQRHALHLCIFPLAFSCGVQGPSSVPQHLLKVQLPLSLHKPLPESPSPGRRNAALDLKDSLGRLFLWLLQVSSGLGEIFWTAASCCSVWCLFCPTKAKSVSVWHVFSMLAGQLVECMLSSSKVLGRNSVA